MTGARCIHLGERGLLAIAGPDRAAFLQGLVSNDVHTVSPSKSLYAGLLTPQGKYLFDFIMASDGERLLLECEARRVEDLRKRLSIYRLRSRVELDDVKCRLPDPCRLGAPTRSKSSDCRTTPVRR